MLIKREGRDPDKRERQDSGDKRNHRGRLTDSAGRRRLSRGDIEFETVGDSRTTTSWFFDLHGTIIALLG